MDYYKPILIKTGFEGNYVKYESKGGTKSSIERYLNLIEPHLRNLINEYKNKHEYKVQLTAEVNFISTKPGSDEKHVMYTKSDNSDIIRGTNVNRVVKELLDSLLRRYQEGLQEKMRGSDFIFDSISYLQYDLNKLPIINYP